MPRNWIVRLVIAVAVLSMVTVGGKWYGAKSNTTAEGAIRVGWVPTATWIPWATMGQELPEDTQLELIPFKSSNDELTALANGSIDMAPVGYNNVAALLGGSDPKVTFVSGISSNGSVFLAGKDSGIKTWEDLRGKRIASVRGSTQYVHLATAMKLHGLDIEKDATYVNMQAFPDLNLGLERGDVDAVVTFPPLSGEAVESGYATTVDDIQDEIFDGSFAVASGVLVNDSYLESDRDGVKTIIAALQRRVDALSAEPQKWEDTYGEVTGSSGALIADSLDKEYIRPEIDMPMSEIMTVPTILAQMGIIDNDTSAQLEAHIDYSILEEVTGKPASELGKND